MMLKPYIASLLIILSGKTFAEFAIPGIATSAINPLQSIDNALAQTGLTQNMDDISTDQDSHTLQLNSAQIHEAKVWGLTLDEEKRYSLLMQNKSAIYYEGLRQTPLDILGINARTEEERNHFAELSATFEAQRVSKNLAWNHAFYLAYNKLFKDVPIVGKTDLSRYSPQQYKPIGLEADDNLYLFIKPTDAVKIILLSLSEALKSAANTHLHIMLLDTSDIGIQSWASQHQIPKEMVAGGKISLNHGELNFNALQNVNRKTPLLLLARNNTSTIVDLGRF